MKANHKVSLHNVTSSNSPQTTVALLLCGL